MRIKFFWKKKSGVYQPFCEADTVMNGGYSILDCILTDDGGVGYVNSIPWLNEALNKISALKNAEINYYDWVRETWGAELTNKEAKLYSLHDENCFQIFDLEVFEQALIAWRDFIQTDPDVEIKVEVEIEIT